MHLSRSQQLIAAGKEHILLEGSFTQETDDNAFNPKQTALPPLA